MRVYRLLMVAAAMACGLAADLPPLPYRFLLVISDQWKDPASYVVEDGGEFQTLVALLKSWGLPFDILRLDQQRLDKYHVLERDGRPRYGTIIWDAGPAQLEGKGLALIPELVREHGVSLVVMGDAVAAPEISALAGVRYVSEFISTDTLRLAGEHFINRGLDGREKDFLPAGAYWPGYKVTAADSSVVMRRGPHPFLTARPAEAGGRVAWLGAHRPSHQLQRHVIRDLFKRALIWAQGYALCAEYPKSIILHMDDMGAPDKTFLPYWHYRTPTEEQLRAGLIEPLKRHGAVLVQNVNTGYVDRKTRRIVSPWRQRVIDEIDGTTVHDFASTKRGLEAGLREGVFEIQSHGWTHMLPDLDSPPGPFWTAPMDGVGTLDWYNEFGDRLRNLEIPAGTQRFHLERSLEQIRADFGVTPLALRPGGSLPSRSYVNHTARIAAQAGFGVATGSSVWYLGRDLVISMAPAALEGGWDYDKRLTPAGIPWSSDGPYWVRMHDRDLALAAGAFARLLDDLGAGVRYMTANEYCAYLHAHVERGAPAAGTLSLAVYYDDHYCRYFATHPSTWMLHLSDETRRGLGTSVPEKQVVELPAGLGRHTVRVGARGISVSRER